MAKMGRPLITFNAEQWKQVEKLCAIQCTAEEISSIMCVDADTLNRLIKDAHNLTFSDYFKRHSSEGKASLRRNQFKMSEHSAVMAIWLGKQWLGQKDIPDVSSETEDAQAVYDEALKEG